MSKPYQTIEHARRHAQAMADLTRERWVWYTDNDGTHRAEKAEIFYHVQINDTILAGEMVIRQRKGGPLKEVAYPGEVPVPEEGPILRCTWCCKDTATNPCEHCESEHTVSDRTIPHRPEWSRATINEVECKVCDRRGPYSIQASPDWCDNTNNPKIAKKHEKNTV